MTNAGGALRQEEPIETSVEEVQVEEDPTQVEEGPKEQPTVEEPTEEKPKIERVKVPEHPFGEEGDAKRVAAIQRLGRIMGLVQSGGRIYGRRGYMERSLPEEDLFWLYRVAEELLTGNCTYWVHHETDRPMRKANIAGDNPTGEETAWMDYMDSQNPLPPKSPPDPEPDSDPEPPDLSEAIKKLGLLQRFRLCLLGSQ